MITAIFNAIAAIPVLLEAMKSFINFLSNALNEAENRKALADLAKASKDAKKDKDTSGMDNVFNPGNKK